MRRLVLLFALVAGPAAAHELWLEPETFAIGPDDALKAAIVNGEDFDGQAFPYLPQRFVAFVNFSAAGAAPVEGRIGDHPAVLIPDPIEGLNVLAYRSRDSQVTYDDWDTILAFVEHKGLTTFLADHAARGFAEEPFTETYSRHSKSLVGVGDAVGADRRTGLETEIVALTNPYTDDLSDGMTFRLWYGDAPRAGARFEVYERAPGGAVAQTFHTTDADGRVTVPVRAGHQYMADAVVYREPSAELAEASGAIWETLWANMTWAVPGAP